VSIKEKIKDWYRGRYVPPPPDDPNSSVFFLSLGHHEQPLVAKLAGRAARFYLAHWQWVIGTTIAIIVAL
jgi:hypothetical protein